MIRFFRSLVKFLLSSDVLQIIRPLVYVCLVLRHGHKSWVPIQVSLAIDLVSVGLVLLRLFGSEKIEKFGWREVKMRHYAAFSKYLLRSPLFESYTEPAIHRLLTFLRIPQLIQDIILAQISYYRYYIYVA